MTRARTLADLGSASLATDAELAAEVATLDSTISGLVTGKVLQVVTNSTSTSTINNTSNFVDTGLSVSITPQSSSSNIVLQAVTPLGIRWTSSASVVVSASARIAYSISGGSSGQLSNISGLGLDNRNSATNNPFLSQNIWSLSLIDTHSPVTTSPITYNVEFRGGSVSGLSFVFNDFGFQATICAMEVSP